jgi:hypothetical protein
MSRRQADEALEADVRDIQIDVRTRLASGNLSGNGLQADAGRAFQESEPKP